MSAFLVKTFIVLAIFFGTFSICAAEKGEQLDQETDEISIHFKSKRRVLRIERKINREKISLNIESSLPISHQNCYLLANRMDHIIQYFINAKDNHDGLKELSNDNHCFHHNDKLQSAKRPAAYKFFKFVGYSTLVACSVGAAAWLAFNWSKLGIFTQTKAYCAPINTVATQSSAPIWCRYTNFSLLGCF